MLIRKRGLHYDFRNIAPYLAGNAEQEFRSFAVCIIIAKAERFV